MLLSPTFSNDSADLVSLQIQIKPTCLQQRLPYISIILQKSKSQTLQFSQTYFILISSEM